MIATKFCSICGAIRSEKQQNVRNNKNTYKFDGNSINFVIKSVCKS